MAEEPDARVLLEQVIDTRPMTPNEFLQCRLDIGEALGVYCTQTDLQDVLQRHRSNINKFERGKIPIPTGIGILMRLVRRAVIPSDLIGTTQKGPNV